MINYPKYLINFFEKYSFFIKISNNLHTLPIKRLLILNKKYIKKKTLLFKINTVLSTTKINT